jgi:hypothetical protein
MSSSGMRCSARRLLVTANVVPSSPFLVTLMMEALRSSETSVLTKATRRNIPEGGILQVRFCLVTTEWRVIELRMEGRPPATDGSYRYTGRAAAQLGDWP